jgi:hypothetical protein
MLAKDILRVNMARLCRFWVRDRPDPTKNPGWVELGHFFAGLDYKLARIREVDGQKRENASNTGYEAQGTFQYAQNAIFDFLTLQNNVTGPLSVAILIGRPLFPTLGTLLVHDWAQNSDKTWNDRRISMVSDPGYTGSILTANGTFSGFISGFELYEVSNLTFNNRKINFTTLASLNPDVGIGVPANTLGGS